MLLQLALDIPHAAAVRRLLDETAFGVDIIELGTPLLIRYGTGIISEIRRDYPETKILADLKIVDAGALESGLAFDAGADIVTVLGTAHQTTLCEAAEQAKQSGGRIMADLITAREADEAVRLAHALDRAGMDFICLHTAFDIRGQEDSAPIPERIDRVGAVVHRAGLAVAGGLNPRMIERLVPHDPDIVVVGRYVTGNVDPGGAVRRIREIMHRTDG
ncbi:MAG: orotidine 5'-phosphate decarboxylase [Gemmatimonadetes bacterium]|nr:orotidine 5'-phosphate decarboxylase [Gemmatimonadota bacterium]